MSLLDALTGGKSSEAAADLDKALQTIRDVRAPTIEDLQYQLEQYVQAGILTPEQARTYLQNPNALEGMNVDQTGTHAQQEAIAGLISQAQQGGLDAKSQSDLAQIIRTMNTSTRGANDAVLQAQAARGALTGGETLAAQLQNNQSAAANANANAMTTAGQAYQNRLNELTSAGALGGTLQGQQNSQANTVAAATNAINQFNAAQEQTQENFNVGNRNQAQAQNLSNLQGIENSNTQNRNALAQQQSQLPQQVFNNNLSKAEAEANALGNQSNLATKQGQSNASLIAPAASFFGFGVNPQAGASGSNAAQSQDTQQTSTGNIPGDSTQTAAFGGEIEEEEASVPGPDRELDIYRGQDGKGHYGISRLASVGGSVPGHAEVEGDSPKNDTVPTMLSPGEIVIPRSVAQNPEPDRVMSFLQRMRKPVQHHPDDIASVLHALSRVREAHS